MVKTTDESKIAYTEVYTILNQLSEKEKSKLPNDLVTQFKNNMDTNYHYEFKINEPIESQNISKKARIILAVIYRDYLAPEGIKEKIKEFEKAEKMRIEAEAKKRYNPDEIFNNKNLDKNIIKKEEKTSMIVLTKEKWYKRIIRKVLDYFKKC